ncbi:MAG: hypothetical protein ABR574_10450 [Cryomorphaceae bacterium]|nr:hypothetical protein [Flavobacteriales bacterium]
MRTLFAFFLILPLLFSCATEEESRELEAITEQTLKNVVRDKKIDALEYCCSDCPCDQKIGQGTDFGFPGNNQVRINDNYYDIDNIFSYRMEIFHDNLQKERRLILYFD